MKSAFQDKVSILPMTEAHIDDVSEIDESYSTAPWSRDLFLKELEHIFSYNFVMFFERELTGFMNFWVIGECLELNNFAIRDNYRGKGLGKYFLMFLIETGKILNVSKIFLEVKEDNLNAFELYKKFDFIVSGVRKKYYSDGSDAVLMERIL